MEKYNELWKEVGHRSMSMMGFQRHTETSS